VRSGRREIRALLEEPKSKTKDTRYEIARLALRLGWWERELAGLIENRDSGKLGGRGNKKT
jgi:hypothetical protein